MEAIFTQGIALHFWRSNLIYIENTYMYIVLCIILQFVLITLIAPLYDGMKGKMHRYRTICGSLERIMNKENKE